MPPGQIRKEAATAGTLCAGVWLVGLPPFQNLLFSFVRTRPSYRTFRDFLLWVIVFQGVLAFGVTRVLSAL